MSTVTLSLLELAGVVGAAVGLAATDAAALSDLFVAYASKKLGVSPGDIRAYDAATDGDGGGGGDGSASAAEAQPDDDAA